VSRKLVAQGAANVASGTLMETQALRAILALPTVGAGRIRAHGHTHETFVLILTDEIGYAPAAAMAAESRARRIPASEGAVLERLAESMKQARALSAPHWDRA
jgi:hypothetical protein